MDNYSVLLALSVWPIDSSYTSLSTISINSISTPGKYWKHHFKFHLIWQLIHSQISLNRIDYNTMMSENCLLRDEWEDLRPVQAICTYQTDHWIPGCWFPDPLLKALLGFPSPPNPSWQNWLEYNHCGPIYLRQDSFIRQPYPALQPRERLATFKTGEINNAPLFIPMASPQMPLQTSPHKERAHLPFTENVKEGFFCFVFLSKRQVWK